MISRAALAVSCCLALPATAHEFIVKPATMDAGAGAAAPVTVIASHVIMKSEELEPPTDMAVWALSGDKREPVSVSPNPAEFTCTGEARAPGGGGFVIASARLPQVWSLTLEGLKMGTPAQLSGARRPMKIEKFSKALANLEAGDDIWSRPIGDRLEIVPLTNPALVKPGQDLAVRILFDRKSLSTRVYATYDGLTDNLNSYAYYTETADDSTARVRLTRPGLWMVRVEQRRMRKRPTTTSTWPPPLCSSRWRGDPCRPSRGGPGRRLGGGAGTSPRPRHGMVVDRRAGRSSGTLLGRWRGDAVRGCAGVRARRGNHFSAAWPG